MVLSLALTFTLVFLLPLILFLTGFFLFFCLHTFCSISQVLFFSFLIYWKRGKTERDGEWLDSGVLMLSNSQCVGSGASACCLSSSCVFFPHLLRGNGYSMAISVLWGMQVLSHLFVVFHRPPSQSSPPTTVQQTTLYKETVTGTTESMDKINRCAYISPFQWWILGIFTVCDILSFLPFWSKSNGIQKDTKLLRYISYVYNILQMNGKGESDNNVALVLHFFSIKPMNMHTSYS